ncbi:MAG: endonuclease/exonuclease/phosphatase family protein [Acidobacteria bacterium]|nr:endonuclease/exonuclease/phosphatase family protein [Acidobacteriota bacterium]
MKQSFRFRVVTYNIHKCRGLDQRVRPDRIVKVLREIDADIIALQEVLCIPNGKTEDNQAQFISENLGAVYRLGETRQLRGGIYGNVVLSRLPLLAAYNYDVSQHGYEERGCLRVDVGLGSHQLLHLYNVHLGTAYRERPQQARRLLDEEILNTQHVLGPRILLGDFNEWTHGVASRLLAEHFQSADLRLHLGRRRTYPGVFPFLHLDHIYYDAELELEAATLHRSRTALLASDHLPLVADFHLRHSPAESE